MEISKAELQKRINELTEDLARGESESEHARKDLEDTQRLMAIVDKPKVTRNQMTEIQDAIYQIVKNVDFTDSNNYDMDFELDYDNRISISSMDFDGAEEISDDICSEVSSLFNIIDTEDEA